MPAPPHLHSPQPQTHPSTLGSAILQDLSPGAYLRFLATKPWPLGTPAPHIPAREAARQIEDTWLKDEFLQRADELDEWRQSGYRGIINTGLNERNEGAEGENQEEEASEDFQGGDQKNTKVESNAIGKHAERNQDADRRYWDAHFAAPLPGAE